jgi:hypothetical protein
VAFGGFEGIQVGVNVTEREGNVHVYSTQGQRQLAQERCKAPCFGWTAKQTI